MTPEQALAALTRAAVRSHGDLEYHQILQQAIGVLAAELDTEQPIRAVDDDDTNEVSG